MSVGVFVEPSIFSVVLSQPYGRNARKYNLLASCAAVLLPMLSPGSLFTPPNGDRCTVLATLAAGELELWGKSSSSNEK